MPSDTAGAVYRSLRRWVRVLAFALGIGLVALAAAVTLLVDLLPESSAPDGPSAAGSEDACGEQHVFSPSRAHRRP